MDFSDDTNAIPGSTVDIDVNVDGFTDLVVLQLSINWDSLVVSFNDVLNITTDLADFTDENIGTPDMAVAVDDGQLTISWTTLAPLGQSLADGTRLFTIRLDVLGDDCDNTNFIVTDMPRDIEIIDKDFNELTTSESGGEVMIPGNCGGGIQPTPCPLAGDTDGVGVTLPEILADNATNVCLPVTVTNFVDLETLQFGMQWDTDVLTYTGIINEVLPVAILLNDSNAANGDIRYVWFDDTGINPLPLPDETVIFDICFDVSGSDGDFSLVEFVSFPGFNIEFAASVGGETVVQPFFADCGSVTIGQEGFTNNFTLVASDETTGQGGQVCVDVSALNFDNIAAMQFSMTWDETILDYNHCDVTNFHSDLNIACSASYFNFFGPDTLRLSWIASDGQGVDIPDEEILFSVCFDVIGDCDDISPFNFISVPGVPIEIGDGNDQAVTPVDLVSGSVTITCQKTIDMDITQPDCFGDFGTATATVNGDMGTVTYTWEACAGGPTLANGPTINQPGCACYRLTVSDDNGSCTAEVNFDCPAEITVTVNSTDATCTAGGSIEIIASGGTGTLECMIADMNQCSKDNLAAGDYTVKVTDSNGCTEERTVTIDNEDDIILESDIKHVDCDGLGAIDLTVVGGVDPTFIWSDNVPFGAENNEDQTGLETGSYTVNVTDGDCMANAEYFILDERPDFVITGTVTHISCNGEDDGSIEVTPSGGCPGYDIDPIDLTGLGRGSHTVTVTDASGQSGTATFTVNEPDVLEITGFVVVNTTGSDGSIDITVMGGTEDYMYSWVGPGNPPFMSSNQDINNLINGEYCVTVTDANDCSVTMCDTVEFISTVIIIDNITVTSDLNGADVSCPGFCDGVIDADLINAQGVVSILATSDGNPNVTGSSFPLTGLCAGDYDILVTDELGNTGTATITLEDPPALTAVVDDIGCSQPNTSTGFILISTSGGTGEIYYDWTGGASPTEQDLNGASAGIYTNFITDDNGCEFMLENIEVELCITDDCNGAECYTALNVITPNGDGYNENFEICCISNNDNTLEIYDRWGKRVFRMDNYDNSWRGEDESGTRLQEGAYYWVLNVNFGSGDNRLFKGTVTILRNR